mgnify:CR=1 FL=1
MLLKKIFKVFTPFLKTLTQTIAILLLLVNQASAYGNSQKKYNTLDGKVFAGYQGWFNAKNDGMDLGYRHYGRNGFAPGNSTVDLWPDLTEFDNDEKYATSFKHADNSTAYVFSSANQKTVNRHFQWMKEYGIDGAFLQRFPASPKNSKLSQGLDKVLENVRFAAKNNQRSWSLMYDLSGKKFGDIKRIVMEDYKRLHKQGIFNDSNYQHHNGKPVISVWGLGFDDNRQYTLEETAELINFLKNDPVYGNKTVMLGVPYWWRELKNDTVNNTLLHDIIKSADIVSPWSVTRNYNLDAVYKRHPAILKKDINWLKQNNLDYMPVICPGFSWYNMKHKEQGDETLFDQIPRLGGKYLWAQAVESRIAGAKMVYVAMFDELDEATAIMKATNQPPVGESPFLTYKGLPSDHYLWLTGQIGRLFRGEIDASQEIPLRLK